MTQYIEALEGIFPISENIHRITRDNLDLVVTYTDDTTLVFPFNTERARDAGYSAIVSGLGCTVLINIAKFQVWD